MKRAYVVDPADPRAPSQAVWDALSDEERRLVISELPGRPSVVQGAVLLENAPRVLEEMVDVIVARRIS